MRGVFGLGIDLPDLLPKPKLSGPAIRSSPTPLRVSPGVTPEFRHRKHRQHSADRPCMSIGSQGADLEVPSGSYDSGAGHTCAGSVA